MSGTLLILLTVYLVGAIAFAVDEDQLLDPLWPLFALAGLVKWLHPKIGNSSNAAQPKSPAKKPSTLEEDRHQKRIEDWEHRFQASLQQDHRDEVVLEDTATATKHSSRPPMPVEDVPLPEIDIRTDSGKKVTHDS